MKMLDDKSEKAPQETDIEALNRLAKLLPLEYERVREAEAERMGVRVSLLDKEVATARSDTEYKAGAGRAIDFEDIAPWPESVDATDLFDEVTNVFRRYLLLPKYAPEIQTLWVAVAHASDAFQHSPRLNVTAPERGCGKTVNLDVISALVPRPVPTENVSIAAFFRLAESYRPTFLMDEYDTYLAIDKSGELRGALNAGHRYGGQVIRCVGDDSEPRGFKVFGPVVLGGIRELPGTLHDRSIVIRMSRAKSKEIGSLDRYDSRRGREHDLARKLARWVADNADNLAAADPDMGRLYNRAADNWRPLYAVADIVGGKWPLLVREAAAAHTTEADETSRAVDLLRDVRAAFGKLVTDKVVDADKIHTKTLLEFLNGIEDRSWGEYGKSSKGLTGHTLSKLLKPFQVKPVQVRIGTTNLKGYRIEDFADAFARYLDEDEERASPLAPSSQSETPKQCGSDAVFQPIENETFGHDVSNRISQNGSNGAGCFDVSIRNPESGENVRDPLLDAFDEGFEEVDL